MARDLTEAPELDTDDPSGTVMDSADYMVAAGLAGAAWALGQSFLAGPISSFVEGVFGGILDTAGDAGDSISDEWGGV